MLPIAAAPKGPPFFFPAQERLLRTGYSLNRTLSSTAVNVLS